MTPSPVNPAAPAPGPGAVGGLDGGLQHRGEALGQGAPLGDQKGDASAPDLPFRPHQALRQAGLREGEGPGQLPCAEPQDGLEHEGGSHPRVDGGVAAEEEEGKAPVGHGVPPSGPGSTHRHPPSVRVTHRGGADLHSSPIQGGAPFCPSQGWADRHPTRAPETGQWTWRAPRSPPGDGVRWRRLGRRFERPPGMA